MPRIVNDELFEQVLETLRSRKQFKAADDLEAVPRVKESKRLSDELGTNVWYEEPDESIDEKRRK